jgi:hypothetical protein
MYSVRHSWKAASILLTSLSCIKKKNKSEYSEHSEHSSEYSSILLGDIELGTQDLLLWALAPVCVAVEMLSRLGSSQPRSAEFHLLPGVVRYCVRSISAADPEVVTFYLPQLVQLLRRDTYNAIKELLLDLACGSVLMSHRLIGRGETSIFDVCFFFFYCYVYFLVILLVCSLSSLLSSLSLSSSSSS